MQLSEIHGTRRVNSKKYAGLLGVFDIFGKWRLIFWIRFVFNKQSKTEFVL